MSGPAPLSDVPSAAHLDHEGRALLILGLGVYPNVRVIDAYATVRAGDTLHAVRASDALGDDRMRLAVGPLRIEAEEPPRRLRLLCDDDSMSYDLAWTAGFPVLWEPHHVQRRGDRLALEGRRFVQAGSVEGVLRADGDEFRITATEWTGTRDGSRGVRPIPGEEGGRFAEEHPTEGFPLDLVPRPLRGPLPDGDRPGRRRRPPLAQ
jgi:hypothetical protein